MKSLDFIFYVCFSLNGIASAVYFDSDMKKAIFFSIMMCVCCLLNIAQNLQDGIKIRFKEVR